jgi:hypothetical protein
MLTYADKQRMTLQELGTWIEQQEVLTPMEQAYLQAAQRQETAKCRQMARGLPQRAVVLHSKACDIACWY